MDILEELTALRKHDAEELTAIEPIAALEKRALAAVPAKDFRGAFAKEGINIIAELKKASPSEGLIRAEFDPVAIAKEYAANGAAAMSVLCEPHKFLGSDEYLRAVRAAVETPLIYKDFLSTPYQILRARACGADAILLIMAVLDDAKVVELKRLANDLGMAALVETHSEEEIKRAFGCGAKLIGVNCRDLRTFKTDPTLTAELVAKIPSGVIRIGESGIKTRDDILKVKAAGADGFLIGTTLMRSSSPGEKLKELKG